VEVRYDGVAIQIIPVGFLAPTPCRSEAGAARRVLRRAIGQIGEGRPASRAVRKSGRVSAGF
jgi:hypothetical protein